MYHRSMDLSIFVAITNHVILLFEIEHAQVLGKLVIPAVRWHNLALQKLTEVQTRILRVTLYISS